MIQVLWETNINNKLLCAAFVEISLPPRSRVSESNLETVIEIKTRDNSLDGVRVKLIDITRVKLGDLRTAHTFPSHGMYAREFIEWWLQKYPTSTLESELAVYYYRRVIEPDPQLETLPACSSH